MTRSRVWRGRQPRKWPHLIEQRILHKKLHRCKVVKWRLRVDNSFDKNSKQLSQGSPTLTLYLNYFCQKGGKRNFVHSKSRKLNRQRSWNLAHSSIVGQSRFCKFLQLPNYPRSPVSRRSPKLPFFGRPLPVKFQTKGRIASELGTIITSRSDIMHTYTESQS